MENIVYAQNGAKIEDVEVSKEVNVIPEGELHKNKHHIDLENITSKGIPVIQNVEGSTLSEIKENGGEIVQSAEIEREEIIFTKELTDYIEEARQHQDQKTLLEVGKRLVKEILSNTNDNVDLIKKLDNDNK